MVFLVEPAYVPTLSSRQPGDAQISLRNLPSRRLSYEYPPSSLLVFLPRLYKHVEL